MKRARIIGTGSYLPKRIMTNQELEEMVETSDEWIRSRTGIEQRRIAAEDEATSDLSIEAAKRALEDAGIEASQLDLIIVATITGDNPTPHTAAWVQSALGAKEAATFDLQAACTGYLYGLATAKAFIESGLARRVLVIAADKLSSIVNWEDRNTCVLFGDGAGAAVVADKGPGLEIRHLVLGSDGCQGEILQVPAGGSRRPATPESIAAKEHAIQMQGREVFRHAVRRVEESAEKCLDELGMDRSEIRWVVPHQANTRIIDAFAKRFAVPSERIYLTIHKYGNTSASAAAIALDELRREQPPEEGDNLLLFGFGAGLSWGTAIVTERKE